VVVYKASGTTFIVSLEWSWVGKRMGGDEYQAMHKRETYCEEGVSRAPNIAAKCYAEVERGHG